MLNAYIFVYVPERNSLPQCHSQKFNPCVIIFFLITQKIRTYIWGGSGIRVKGRKLTYKNRQLSLYWVSICYYLFVAAHAFCKFPIGYSTWYRCCRKCFFSGTQKRNAMLVWQPWLNSFSNFVFPQCQMTCWMNTITIQINNMLIFYLFIYLFKILNLHQFVSLLTSQTLLFLHLSMILLAIFVSAYK